MGWFDECYKCYGGGVALSASVGGQKRKVKKTDKNHLLSYQKFILGVPKKVVF